MLRGFESSADENCSQRSVTPFVNDVSNEVLSPYLIYLKDSYGNSPEDRI